MKVGTRIEVAGDKRLPDGSKGVVLSIGRDGYIVEIDGYQPHDDGRIWFIAAEDVKEAS